MDRRIERTKHSLQESLLALIRDMPYEDIEIQPSPTVPIPHA